ncbi:MAG TPA: class I SAM-dependent methyltransferase [archaeon]|nr:class I SAM-dependent methyltransferase [archaeon]
MPSPRRKPDQYARRRAYVRSKAGRREGEIDAAKDFVMRYGPNGNIGEYRRNLEKIQRDHGVNFRKKVGTLKARFPKQRIEILNEGCGESSFAAELASEKGIRITNSDLVDRHSQPNFHKVSVHDLARRFGKNRFHLVVSTRGGVDWGGDSRSSLSNIYEILKPGGEAYITQTWNFEYLLEVASSLGIPAKLSGTGIKMRK